MCAMSDWLSEPRIAYGRVASSTHTQRSVNRSTDLSPGTSNRLTGGAIIPSMNGTVSAASVVKASRTRRMGVSPRGACRASAFDRDTPSTKTVQSAIRCSPPSAV